jgi:hypothetical protein
MHAVNWKRGFRLIANASSQKCGTLLACTPWAQEKGENSAQQPSFRVLVGRKRSAETGLVKELAKRGESSKEPSVQGNYGRGCQMQDGKPCAQGSNRGLKRFYMKRRARSLKNTKMKDKLAKDENMRPWHSYKFRNLSHSRGKR